MGNLLDPTESQIAHQEGKNRRNRGGDRRRSAEDVGLLEKIREWCRGKSGNARLPFAVYCGGLLVVYFFNQDAAANIDLLNALLHKLGHFIWGLIVPDTPIAGGWLIQFGAPVVAMFVFYRNFDYFGVALSFAWAGTALLWNAPYCIRADAGEAGEFPPSILNMNEPLHDWNYLLTNTNSLQDAGAIAESMRWGGLLALAFGLYFLGSQLYFMYTLEERRKETERRVMSIAVGK